MTSSQLKNAEFYIKALSQAAVFIVWVEPSRISARLTKINFRVTQNRVKTSQLVSSFSSILILMTAVGFGQFVHSAPKVGRKAAAKYFENADRTPASREESGQHLWLHVGKAISSQAYNWKESGKVEGVGTATYGVSYLFDEWSGVDAVLRGDFTEYDLSGTRAVKLSFLPVLTFPKLETRFPLYFGIGMGLGVYFQQVEAKSNISGDYQLFLGVRLLDISPGVGAFVEFGLKNHVHLLSEGQYNGTYIVLGPHFSF